MGRHLLLILRFHGDGQGTARFHGMGQGGQEWPPSPARLFQALVAGIARGGKLLEESVPALRWLEGLEAPVIAAPLRKSGQSVSLFVPNNDADSLNDPRDVSSIRTKKRSLSIRAFSRQMSSSCMHGRLQTAMRSPNPFCRRPRNFTSWVEASIPPGQWERLSIRKPWERAWSAILE
jgi:hypothetical protein